MGLENKELREAQARNQAAREEAEEESTGRVAKRQAVARPPASLRPTLPVPEAIDFDALLADPPQAIDFDEATTRQRTIFFPGLQKVLDSEKKAGKKSQQQTYDPRTVDPWQIPLLLAQGATAIDPEPEFGSIFWDQMNSRQPRTFTGFVPPQEGQGVSLITLNKVAENLTRLPFLGSTIESIWQQQELGLDFALPALKGQVEALFPGLINIDLEDLRLMGVSGLGENIYEATIIADDSKGRSYRQSVQMLLDPMTNKFTPYSPLPSSGMDLTDFDPEKDSRNLFERVGITESTAELPIFDPTTSNYLDDLLDNGSIAEVFDKHTRLANDEKGNGFSEVGLVNDLVEEGLTEEAAQQLLAYFNQRLAWRSPWQWGMDTIYENLGPLLDPLIEQQLIDDPIDNPFANGFSGGGGGGGGGQRLPEYQPSDQGLVEDWVKSLLVSLVGVSSVKRVNELVALYMADEYSNWSGQGVDPRQSVREAIRQYAEYKAIHRLRPESVNEEDWIASQLAGLNQAGVRVGALTDRAILQAQVGVSPARAGEAATLSELAGTGRALPRFMQQMEKVAANMFRRVR